MVFDFLSTGKVNDRAVLANAAQECHNREVLLSDAVKVERVSFRHPDLAQLSELAVSSRPREICGALFGHIAGATVYIKHAVALPNSKRSPFCFGITSVDLNRAIRLRREAFLGIFHSHSTDNELSDTDKASFMKSSFVWAVLDSSRANVDNIEAFISCYVCSSSTIKKLRTSIREEE